MSAKKELSRMSSEKRTTPKKDNGSEFGAAFSANLKRSYGTKNSKSVAHAAKAWVSASTKPTGLERGVKKESSLGVSPEVSVPRMDHQNGDSTALKLSAGSEKSRQQPVLPGRCSTRTQSPSENRGPPEQADSLEQLAEVRETFVDLLCSLRNQERTLAQSPTIGDALRIFDDPSISTDDFIRMSWEIMSSQMRNRPIGLGNQDRVFVERVSAEVHFDSSHSSSDQSSGVLGHGQGDLFNKNPKSNFSTLSSRSGYSSPSEGSSSVEELSHRPWSYWRDRSFDFYQESYWLGVVDEIFWEAEYEVMRNAFGRCRCGCEGLPKCRFYNYPEPSMASKKKEKDVAQTDCHKLPYFSHQQKACFISSPSRHRIFVTRAKEAKPKENLSPKSGHDEKFNEASGDKRIDACLMGKQKIAAWKVGAGRSKDWRLSRYAKATTRRQATTQDNCSKRLEMEVRFPGVPLTPIFNGLGRFSPAVTLKSYQLSRSSSLGIQVFFNQLGLVGNRSTCKREHLQSSRLCYLDLELNYTDEQRKFATLPHTLEVYKYQAETRQEYVSATSSSDPASPLTIHYLGSILLSPYGLLRLQSHIYTSSHYSTYILEDLDTSLQYEAKIYSLRDLHPKQRKRRIENLKKATDSLSFLYSFDLDGKKYCVFVPSEPEMKRDILKLGASSDSAVVGIDI